MAKAYLSAPFASEVQKGGVHRIVDILVKHEFEVISPEGFAEEGRFKRASDNMTARLEAINGCDLVVSWFDFLFPKGAGIYQVHQTQTQLDIPFPPETQEMLAVASRVMEKSGHIPKGKTRRLIMTPQELAAPVKHPTGMTVDLSKDGAVLAMLGKHPLNIPDGDVMVELGIAAAAGKSIIGVGLAVPMLGVYGASATDILVSTLENLDTVLRMFVEDGGGKLTASLVEKMYETIRPAEKEAPKETSEGAGE